MSHRGLSPLRGSVQEDWQIRRPALFCCSGSLGAARGSTDSCQESLEIVPLSTAARMKKSDAPYTGVHCLNKMSSINNGKTRGRCQQAEIYYLNSKRQRVDIS
ncbi:hypothetical protein BaRGS_00030347 [Batillaria attramentaria]|uniref:Uncharacterized protein n=1 Tax=Batillaria attramentaria TaxID=370345 RepID=A0ABD0JTV7_9CAEN